MIYIILFAVGYVAGFFSAALLAAAGRSDNNDR